ncbi:hypothetical protein LSH36_58g12031 [Paralvinella palmiformis]|uniref:Uncharacterized protein n=1 Tax=Paralvinella palmiformis TaxID=53620 RepID=A0AAD9K5B8_9ANNE|nr:hypothetical protein LSH36_58g12031 [Paralvinella palmiformis]
MRRRLQDDAASKRSGKVCLRWKAENRKKKKKTGNENLTTTDRDSGTHRQLKDTSYGYSALGSPTYAGTFSCGFEVRVGTCAGMRGGDGIRRGKGRGWRNKHPSASELGSEPVDKAVEAVGMWEGSAYKKPGTAKDCQSEESFLCQEHIKAISIVYYSPNRWRQRPRTMNFRLRSPYRRPPGGRKFINPVTAAYIGRAPSAPYSGVPASNFSPGSELGNRRSDTGPVTSIGDG